MLAKVSKVAVLVTIVATLVVPVNVFAMPNRVKKQKCSMKPIKVYYDEMTEKQFTPTEKEKEQAAEIYERMQKGDLRVRASEYGNLGRLYGIIETEYFPYIGCRCSASLYGDEDDFLYFKELNTQSAIRINKDVEKKVKKTITSLKINKKTTQVNAIKKINKWICKNMYYDTRRARARNNDDYSDADYAPSILSGKGICGDYARTFTYLANYCGIDSGCVINKNVTHEYNLVRIAKKTYYMDVCYNDTSRSNAYTLLSKSKLNKAGHTIGEIIWYGGNSYYNTADCYK